MNLGKTEGLLRKFRNVKPFVTKYILYFSMPNDVYNYIKCKKYKIRLVQQKFIIYGTLANRRFCELISMVGNILVLKHT